MPTPLTSQQLDEIEARANAATKGPWGFYDGDNYADVAADMQVTSPGSYNYREKVARLEDENYWDDQAHEDDDEDCASEQMAANAAFIAHAREDVPVLLAEVRRLTDRVAELEEQMDRWRRTAYRVACTHEPDADAPRTLTEGEYSAAWHAVEGAAGEEGADPATVLHAVLDRLGIARPGTAAPAEEQQPTAEACGKCHRPFDPADTSFDGAARYHLTPYCLGCVDACHDNEIADHRCVICA
ncbi:MAG TPA: hypothetical protein VI172_07445 [Candidatus Dormibacteraeota bacterium]|jgi:hypothetical protein